MYVSGHTFRKVNAFLTMFGLNVGQFKVTNGMKHIIYAEIYKSVGDDYGISGKTFR